MTTTKFVSPLVPGLTGEELEFFEKVTTALVNGSGKRRNHFRTYKLTLSAEGFRRLVWAMKQSGGKLEVPEFDPNYREQN